jgi:hypothetical protein
MNKKDSAAADMSHGIDRILAFLETQDPKSIPKRIQGRIMSESLHCQTTFAYEGINETCYLYTGLDPNSCTSTAAAVAHWLCRLQGETALTLGELRSHPELKFHPESMGSIELSALVSEESLKSFLAKSSSSAQLLVFSTAPHKFAVVCMGGRAALLHSNQDDTLLGIKKFSLQQYLSAGCVIMEWPEFAIMVNKLAAAVEDESRHRIVFKELFGIPFARGNPEDYWVVALPIRPDLLT